MATKFTPVGNFKVQVTVEWTSALRESIGLSAVLGIPLREIVPRSATELLRDTAGDRTHEKNEKTHVYNICNTVVYTYSFKLILGNWIEKPSLCLHLGYMKLHYMSHVIQFTKDRPTV